VHEQLGRVGKQAAGFIHAMAKLATARLLNVHALELDTYDVAYARTMSIVLSRWRAGRSRLLCTGVTPIASCMGCATPPRQQRLWFTMVGRLDGLDHEDLGPRRRSLAEQAELPTPSPHVVI